MRKKLTITVDEDVYEGLRHVVGPRGMGQFIEDLVRPHVVEPDLERQYRDMAADEQQEQEALEWADPP